MAEPGALYTHSFVTREANEGREVWWGYRGWCGGGSKVAYHTVVTMYTTQCVVYIVHTYQTVVTIYTTPHIGVVGD